MIFFTLCMYLKCLTYSMVIWDTTSKLVKPSLAKFSLYWPILMASSHSSTVLKEEKSWVLRSSRGKWTLVDRKKTEEEQPVRQLTCEGCSSFTVWSDGGPSCRTLMTEVSWPWGYWGCGSSCPGCWQSGWIWAGCCGLSASSPASAGAVHWDNP